MEINNKKFALGMFALAFALITFVILTGLVSAQYVRSNPAYVQPGSFTTFGSEARFVPDRSLCQAGQDFVIQISPLGCDPKVVPSDLLEEQNVPVFCPLIARKINSLIDVNVIDSISFSGQYPEGVSGVGFHPARAALGRNFRQGLADTTGLLNNIGYAVIVLRQQPNEASMPDFVEGNLSARIRYDIENAFGVGRSSFYLSELSDEDYEDNKFRNSFWDGRFHLRTESIDEEDAIISISTDVQRVGSVRLKEGETSDTIFLPGFDCFAGARIRLDDLTSPVTRAQLRIGSDLIEVAEGEKFLKNRCEIVRGGISASGLVQSVDIVCRDDDGKRERFELTISPQVRLSVNGEEGNYAVGQRITTLKGEGIYVTLISSSNINSINEENLNVHIGTHNSNVQELNPAQLVEAQKTDKRFVFNTQDTLNNSSEITLLGYADSEELDLNDGGGLEGVGEEKFRTSVEIDRNYDSAIDDFDVVITDFFNEKYPDPLDENDVFISEEAFVEKIKLANTVKSLKGQKDVSDFCDDFKSTYSNSKLYENVKGECEQNKFLLTNSEVSTRSVSVNRQVSDISFLKVTEPTREEFGGVFFIRDLSQNDQSFTPTLKKNEEFPLGSGEFVKLIDLTEESARINIRLKDASDSEMVITGTRTIRKNEQNSFGSNYLITLTGINLKKVAKVSVIPNIQNSGTDATFQYKIGIDKRDFELSPEKAKKKIEQLDKSIEKWDEISDNLGNFVQGMKAACFATGAALTAKNLFTGAGGEALARQQVMKGDGGWYEICADKVSKGEFVSQEQCLFENADVIDEQVKNYAQDINELNDDLSSLRETYPEDEEFLNAYSKKVASRLNKVKCNSVIGEDNDIDYSSVNSGLSLKSDEGYLDIEQVRDLDLWTRRIAEDEKDLRAKDEYCSRAFEIQKGYEDRQEVFSTQTELNNAGFDSNVRAYGTEGSLEATYSGGTILGSKIMDVDDLNMRENYPFEVFTCNGEKYVAILSHTGGRVYTSISIYEYTSASEGSLIVGGDDVRENIMCKFSKFTKFDVSDYKNPYKNYEVRYYETVGSKGQPAIVPFDIQNGWYVATSHVFSSPNGLQAFSASGRVDNFWLCNVGENGLEQNKKGDDICQGINLAIGDTYGQFYGLSRSETRELVGKAVRAIEDAQQGYGSGVKNIRILSQSIPVGNPAADVPDAQCTDFMSPSDCKLLFNVCDPVICPSSRCDFGGAYPVRDVVQTGIVGSVALCLPNFQEGIYIPVCLTGVQAGVDGWNSVQKEYRACLQDSIDTGQLTGICDEIYSIHSCEFFWRQSVPLAKIALPKLISFATGESARGGGEYALVQSSLDNAQGSFDYFTNYYAANSFRAFKARSTDEFGEDICGNFISGVFPSGGKFFERLTEPDSPPQFHGRFDEETFTTATNPPVSHYKVFYFIYAGKDSRAFYQVYLKGDPGSSFFQDTGSRRIVASGFIPRGEQISETRDFTAPSGYREMCINVNGQEECGFQEVSTSFAVNFIKDSYLADQVTKKVTSEQECVSGTPSAFTLLNPNIQSGVEQTINPELYNRGITRICATKNPGFGTDPSSGIVNQSRWVDVGYCGDESLRCWLDTDSAKDVIKNLNIEGDALAEVNSRYQELLGENPDLINEEDANVLITQIGKELNGLEKVNEIDKVINKVFFNHQKAYLYFLRGQAYAELAKEAFVDLSNSETERPGADDAVLAEDIGDRVEEVLREERVNEAGFDSFVEGIESDFELDPRLSTVSSFELRSAMNSLSQEITPSSLGDSGSDVPLFNRNCASFVDEAMDAARDNDIPDPAIILAIMQKESSCNPNLQGPTNDYGIMQITKVAVDDSCQGLVSNFPGDLYNPSINVDCGSAHLRKNYDRSVDGRIFTCTGVRYDGWAAAVRGYNGWGCTGNNQYVEEVTELYYAIRDMIYPSLQA